jgi:hypothetical protein
VRRESYNNRLCWISAAGEDRWNIRDREDSSLGWGWQRLQQKGAVGRQDTIEPQRRDALSSVDYGSLTRFCVIPFSLAHFAAPAAIGKNLRNPRGGRGGVGRGWWEAARQMRAICAQPHEASVRRILASGLTRVNDSTLSGGRKDAKYRPH